MKMRKGFSMIEVILVLAVAGLIFAATFIALPSLWTSERDAARKDNMVSFITELKNYQTNNNRGSLPNADKATLDAGRVVEVKFDAHGARTTPAANANVDDNSWAGFYKNFMGDDFTDPTGQKYNLYVTNCIKTTSVKPGEACNNNNLSTLNPDNNYDLDYTIYVAIGATCDSNQAVRSLNMRNVAIIYKLERAGLYCYNS